MATATAIELEARTGPNHTTTTFRPSITTTTTTTTTPTPLDPDSILAASLTADAAVPDGGYGWIVILGCATITWWFVGTSYCWGVFQSAFVEQGLASPATLAFVGSTSGGCMALLATLSARVVRRLGARYAGMFGVGLIGLGEVLSGEVTGKVGGLIVTAGVLVGLGSSLCFMIVTTVGAQYFSRKRGLANGFIFAGGGLGGAVTSFAIDALIRRFGTAWAYRVLGLVTLATGLPAAWLVKERTKMRTPMFIEWRLFRDSRFAIIFLAGAIGTFPLFVPPFFLPLYGRSIGLKSSAGAGLVAAFNFASAIGRIVSGLLCDRLGPLNTLFLALTLSAVSMLALWPISNSLAPMIVFAIVNGASNGGFFATMPTVVGNVFGSARVSVAMGMIVTGWGGGYLMGAPIAGYILEAYGGEKGGLQAFRPAMFYAGSMALASAGLVALVRLRIASGLAVKV